jgi:hypothetical protein
MRVLADLEVQGGLLDQHHRSQQEGQAVRQGLRDPGRLVPPEHRVDQADWPDPVVLAALQNIRSTPN